MVGRNEYSSFFTSLEGLNLLAITGSPGFCPSYRASEHHCSCFSSSFAQIFHIKVSKPFQKNKIKKISINFLAKFQFQLNDIFFISLYNGRGRLGGRKKKKQNSSVSSG